MFTINDGVLWLLCRFKRVACNGEWLELDAICVVAFGKDDDVDGLLRVFAYDLEVVVVGHRYLISANRN